MNHKDKKKPTMTAIRNNKQFSNKKITCNNNKSKKKKKNKCNMKQGKKQTCKDLVVHLLASIIVSFNLDSFYICMAYSLIF